MLINVSNQTKLKATPVSSDAWIYVEPSRDKAWWNLAIGVDNVKNKNPIADMFLVIHMEAFECKIVPESVKNFKMEGCR